MALLVYNSLTKQKEELTPLEDNIIRMYTCGVTVYDLCHLGHARSLYIFQVICNYLRFRGFDVHFVRNITDIDDKIINRAKELGISWEKVAKENIYSYYQDLESLGIPPADAEPRATENIGDIIKAVEGLIAKGFAYEVDGDVYFEVRKFQEYGKLSGQSIENILEAVRIEKDAKKKDPLDFALWKKSKEGEPSWPSPWGEGRPGWHIECSVMSLKHLGCETLDIHAGGRDLIFPHHENEIAQAEALTGKPFARYWIHHGLLTINGQKMAKSLGNFITIRDAVEKYDVNDLKLFFLSSHYSSPIDFTERKIEEAHKAMQRIDILFWKAAEIIQKEKDVQPREADFVNLHKKKFIEAMDDDFNTPEALASLFNLIAETNKFIDTHKEEAHYAEVVYGAVNAIEKMTQKVFGLFVNEEQRKLSHEEKKLLEERKEARAQKNYKRSDEIRDLLKEKGIIVEDTPEGQTWRWA